MSHCYAHVSRLKAQIMQIMQQWAPYETEWHIFHQYKNSKYQLLGEKMQIYLVHVPNPRLADGLASPHSLVSSTSFCVLCQC